MEKSIVPEDKVKLRNSIPELTFFFEDKVKLQKKVTEFVTSVILKHEKEFYTLTQTYFKNKMNYLLNSTCSSIIEMIVETTNKFYNDTYHNIQNKNNTDIVKIILKMRKYTEYDTHILLDKLLRLTLEIHLDVIREKLTLKNDRYDLYEESVLCQINTFLSSFNLLHVLSKGTNEDGTFVNIPEGENAFNIVIDKNIKN